MLLRRPEDSEARITTVIGIATVAVSAVAALVWWATPAFGRDAVDAVEVVIETPSIAQGVAQGTAVMMHGVQIGHIDDVASLRGGGVRLHAQLQRQATAGLTDSAAIDFRPANYFGVTGVDLRAGQGGAPLTDGSVIKSTTVENFSMQTMLSRLGGISRGVLTPQLIAVIEKAARYTDGLDPLFETMFVVANSVANVQTVSASQLLTNAAGISVASPGFVDAASSSADLFVHSGLEKESDDFYNNTYRVASDLTSSALFGDTGKLAGDHSADLAPAVELTKTLTDVVPGLVPADTIGDSLKELRGRLERLFSGTPEQRAVQVQVVLDSLPGVAAAVGPSGGQ